MDYPILECVQEAEAIGQRVWDENLDFNAWNIDDDKYLLKIFSSEYGDVMEFVCNTYEYVVFSHSASDLI